MRLDGRCKFWNKDKGFGFIVPDNGGGDVFCHATGLLNDSELWPSDLVEYELATDPRTGRPIAINVRVVATSC